MTEKRPYRIGLALSGGGARGFAHLGALYALDEMGIKPDIIAGVSAGSIAGAMYGSGLAPLDILKLFFTSKFSDFCDLGVPKDGFFNMDPFKAFLRANLPVKNIEECPTPTVICATDLDNCVPVQWRSGPIAERVMASCAMPIVFKPIKVDGISYVDGGVLHNLPAWAIRDDCDLLIGINCSPLRNHSYKHTIIDIALRSYMLIARANAVHDMELCDITVQTTAIADLKVFNMKEKDRVFKSGYKAVREALRNTDLSKLIPST